MSKTPRRTYQTALGIQTGDIVTTSYNTGPYEVWSIHGPHLWEKHSHYIIYPWPIVHLTLVYAKGYHLFGKPGLSYVNEIHQEGNRWLTTVGDEVIVTPPPNGYPNLQIDMLRSYPPPPKPYPFQDGVDYEAGHRRVWHCHRCGLDFNWQPTSRHGPPNCPQCNRVAYTRVILAVAGENTYVKILG